MADPKQITFDDVIVDFSAWDRALTAVQKGVSLAIRDLAFLALDEVQENIVKNEQVDTGAMKASAFVHIGGDSDSLREQAKAEAAKLAAGPGAKTKGGREFEAFPSEYTPETPLEAKVGISASYAGPQEKRLAFLGPAVDKVREIATKVAQERVSEALGQ